MNKIMNWFIEPYGIIKSEWSLLSHHKQQDLTSSEKTRVKELQSFNIMLGAVYTLFFIIFMADLVMLIFGNWYSAAGVVFGLLMMALIKKIQVTRYLKRRDAYIKKDPSLIKQ